MRQISNGKNGVCGIECCGAAGDGALMVPTIILGHDFNIIFGPLKVLKIKKLKKMIFSLL